MIRITDRGPGIDDLAAILAGALPVCHGYGAGNCGATKRERGNWPRAHHRNRLGGGPRRSTLGRKRARCRLPFLFHFDSG